MDGRIGKVVCHLRKGGNLKRAKVNQGYDLHLRLENLVITGACLSSRGEDRLVLQAIRREPSDFGGLVMSRPVVRAQLTLC